MICFNCLTLLLRDSLCSEIPASSKTSASKLGVIIGAAAGGFVLLLLIVLAGAYAFHKKQRAIKATKLSNPFGMMKVQCAPGKLECCFCFWNSLNCSSFFFFWFGRCMISASWDAGSGDTPQLKGTRWFSLEELKKCTNNFSEAYCIGFGGYGKVIFITLNFSAYVMNNLFLSARFRLFLDIDICMLSCSGYDLHQCALLIKSSIQNEPRWTNIHSVKSSIYCSAYFLMLH